MCQVHLSEISVFQIDKQDTGVFGSFVTTL